MTVKIIPFQSKYSVDFHDLNIEWLKSFFYVEPYDKEVLSQPERYIISKGGHIFFAKLNNDIVGTVALMPTDEYGVFELTKMAVSPKFRGQKIGQQLLQYCVDFGRSELLHSLMLYSNTKLENAIYLYKKFGFKELELEKNNPYDRADIKMLLKL